MATIFKKIIDGELPCHKVAEDENFLAFFDINPLSIGHTLVIPKNETDYIFDMEKDEYEAFWTFAKKVSKGLKSVFPCEKIGVSVVGLEVLHAHIHLIPIDSVADMNFAKAKLTVSSDELSRLAKEVSEVI